MTPAGIEPAIFGMKARRPRPLDDGAVPKTVCILYLKSCLPANTYSLAKPEAERYNYQILWAGSSVVEQEPFKLLVVGSNPPRLTFFKLGIIQSRKVKKL